MSRIAAPAFPFTHDTFAGPTTSTLPALRDGDTGWTTATITGVNFNGTGSSRRATLVLTAADGTMTGATINARRCPKLIDVLTLAAGDGQPVDIDGTVRRTPGMAPTIDVTGIVPAGTRDSQAAAHALAA